MAGPTDSPHKRYEYQQIRMGVPFRIVLYAPNQALANTASRDAFRRIKQLNSLLSDYDPDSELRRLCRLAAPSRPQKVSSELWYVLSRSQQLSRETDGAFDVTVGPIVKLWRKARRKKRLPDAPSLMAARDLVGFGHVKLDTETQSVSLERRQMLLDLGGIAKGYAGDEALSVLRRHGITRALVDGSGDIVIGDPPPDKPGWRIAVEPLVRKGSPPLRYLILKNIAVATSGDAYQSVTIDGVRYSHIVDPKTGLGLTERSSVTVIAADGITADSLASAVSVLGQEKGIAFVDQTNGAAALVVEIHDGTAKELASQRFAEFQETPAEPSGSPGR